MGYRAPEVETAPHNSPHRATLPHVTAQRRADRAENAPPVVNIRDSICYVPQQKIFAKVNRVRSGTICRLSRTYTSVINITGYKAGNALNFLPYIQ